MKNLVYMYMFTHLYTCTCTCAVHGREPDLKSGECRFESPLSGVSLSVHLPFQGTDALAYIVIPSCEFIYERPPNSITTEKHLMCVTRGINVQYSYKQKQDNVPVHICSFTITIVTSSVHHSCVTCTCSCMYMLCKEIWMWNIRRQGQDGLYT